MLVAAAAPPYLCAMHISIHLVAILAVFAALPALAQPHPARPAAPKPAARVAPAAPREIGKFEDWTAATHQEAGQTVCYAFTRASASTPSLPGRGDVVLTVTERPGAARDAVALSAGFAYAQNAAASAQIDQATMPLYTAQRSAFARDGKAMAAAMERGHSAIIKSPGLRNASVTDTFSLRGFSPAYAAINKACPARG